VVIGGDINEDLNKAANNKRSKYLWEFINDCHLKFNNTTKTFTNAMGKECSEIDYFLHNLSTYLNKEVIDTIVENTSDHHPIRMVFKFEHKAYKNESKNVQKIERKIKWEKVDKDLYMTMVQTNTEQLQNQLANSELTLDAVVSKTCQLMKNAAVASSSAKLSYNAKPKLKAWTTEIKSAFKIMRSKYKIWKDKGKPRDTNNPICKEKKESKKEFRRLIRVELVKQRDEEKELIMETKTKDMRLFHKLVRNNRKKGNDVIMDLNVDGIQYEGEENIITGIREHFRQLATLDPEMDIDNKYHNMVEEEIKIINEIVVDKNILNINSDESN
jgi:hypothetical protein